MQLSRRDPCEEVKLCESEYLNGTNVKHQIHTLVGVVSAVQWGQHHIGLPVMSVLDLGVQNVHKHIRAVEIVAVGDAQPLALCLLLHVAKGLVGSGVARVTHFILQ